MFSGDTAESLLGSLSTLPPLSAGSKNIFICSIFLFLALETPKIEREVGLRGEVPGL